jgi:hypothetical protein
MSTDAFFFFHMDRDTQGTPAPAADERAARLSTSSSSVVSSHARKQFLVEYSPKPAVPAPAAPVAVYPRHQREREQHQREVTTQALAIHRWLATHRSYEPIEHSSFSDDEESESESESEADESDSETDEDDEEDQIYMAPRRQHSAPSILPVPQPRPQPTASALPRKAWPLSAARPAMPVVDRAEATAFTTTLPQDKERSYWSDDDEDEEQEQEWLEDEDDEDDLDLPALDADSGAPASTSTRSLPIPIFPPPRTQSHTNFNDAERAHDFDSLWNSSPPSKQRRPQDGQSFWAPWLKDYMATQKLVQ